MFLVLLAVMFSYEHGSYYVFLAQCQIEVSNLFGQKVLINLL